MSGEVTAGNHRNSREFKMGVKINLVLSLLFLSTFQTELAGAEKILFFWGITTYSHRISVWPLVEKLAELGHSVTFLSAHPPKSLANPKVEEIVPKSLEAFYKATFKDSDLLEGRFAGGIEHLWNKIPYAALHAYELLAKDEDFLEFYRKSSFDLIYIDSLYSEFALGIAHKSKAKFAVFCTTAPYVWQYEDLGMSHESSWLPDMQWHFPEGEAMSLYDRFWNTYLPVRWNSFRNQEYYPRLERIFREELGLKDMPELKDMQKNVSIVLANTHYGEEYGRALPPLVVPVGGLHCSQSQDPTPKELQAFMDSTGSNGFFYVSFGSAADISKMPAHIRKSFFLAMANSKTSFLLKWSGERPEDMPKNAFTLSWIPQQNVLEHPNIKGFITHGGLLGIQEAVCSGVPMIVMPIFAEQDFNANRVHSRRRGIKMELTTLTQDKLETAISSLLHDPSYKENMVRASTLFLDRPQKPIDVAVWWTEYALRHGNVPELKPLGIHQTPYQRRLVDVWLAVFFVVIFLPLLGLILLLSKCYNTSKTSTKNKRD